MLKLFALEGPSYAGKTTTVTFLSSEIPQIQFIPEFNRTAGGDSNFPPPPKTKEEALKAIRYFVKLERKRQNWIRKALSGGKIVLQDRSLLSCIAYNYGV